MAWSLPSGTSSPSSTRSASTESISGDIHWAAGSATRWALQRASLEVLQNAQNSRDALDRYAEASRSVADVQDKRLDRIGDQLATMSTDLSAKVETQTDDLRVHASTLRDVQRHLMVTRTLAIVTLVLLIAFAAATAFNIL